MNDAVVWAPLVQDSSGNVLTATSDGHVVLAPWIDASYQRWRLIEQSDGTVSVISQRDGQALDWDGTQLVTRPPSTSSTQVWQMVAGPTDGFTLVQQDRAIDGDGQRTALDVPTHQAGQVWNFGVPPDAWAMSLTDGNGAAYVTFSLDQQTWYTPRFNGDCLFGRWSHCRGGRPFLLRAARSSYFAYLLDAGGRLYFSQSADATLWSPPVAIDFGQGEIAAPPRVIPALDGDGWLMYALDSAQRIHVLRSSDCITWTAASGSLDFGSDWAAVHTTPNVLPSHDGRSYLMVLLDNQRRIYVATSSDGLSWSGPQYDRNFLNFGVDPQTSQWAGVGSTPAIFHAPEPSAGYLMCLLDTNNRAYIASSSDGLTWTGPQVGVNNLQFDNGLSTFNDTPNVVARDGGGYLMVLVDESGRLYLASSTDGLSWSGPSAGNNCLFTSPETLRQWAGVGVSPMLTRFSGIPTDQLEAIIKPDRSDWMGQFCSPNPGLEFGQLVVAGTHHCDSVTLTTNLSRCASSLLETADGVFSVLSKFPLVAGIAAFAGIGEAELGEITRSKAICQLQEVATQLQAGVRYFDVRACYNSSDGQFYSHHQVVGVNTAVTLQTFASFLDAHPREVVFIEVSLSSEQGGDASINQAMIKLLADTLGDRMYVRAYEDCPPLAQIKLSDVIASGRRAVLLLDSSYFESSLKWDTQYFNVWSKADEVDDFYIGGAKVEYMMEMLARQLSMPASGRARLLKMQFILEITGLMLQVSPWPSLRQLEVLLARLGPLLREFMAAPRLRRPNVLFIDFLAESPAVELAFQQLLRPGTQPGLPALSTSRTDTLFAGRSLYTGGKLISANGRFEALYQTDGNFVVYRKLDGRPVWATGTSGKPNWALTLDNAGNLSVYETQTELAWYANPDGPDGFPGPRTAPSVDKPGAKLVLSDHGELVLYDENDVVYWSTGTPTPPTWLTCGEFLARGEMLASPDGRYQLRFQASDGNLVLYDVSDPSSEKPIWASGQFADAVKAGLLQDGTFVLVDGQGTNVWWAQPDSDTGAGTANYNENGVAQRPIAFGQPGSMLVVGDNGHLVLTNNDGASYWSTGSPVTTLIPRSPTGTITEPTNTLPAGSALTPGQKLSSSNAAFELRYQTDGNLVLYDLRGGGQTPAWSTNTMMLPAFAAGLTDDGAFLVWEGEFTTLWLATLYSSNGGGVFTASPPPATGRRNSKLVLNDDGTLVAYDSQGAPYWQSGVASTPATNTLRAGASLSPGDKLTSASGAYVLEYQLDGNLVVRRVADNVVTFATMTDGSEPHSVGFTANGNFVVQCSATQYVWAANDSGGYGGTLVDTPQALTSLTTGGLAAPTLTLGDDGNLTIVAGGFRRWTTTPSTLAGLSMNNPRLVPFSELRSANGEYALSFTYDGNLVVRRQSDGAQLFASGTSSRHPFCAQLLATGQLAVLSSEQDVVWVAPPGAAVQTTVSALPQIHGSTVNVGEGGNLVALESMLNGVTTTLWSVPMPS